MGVSFCRLQYTYTYFWFIFIALGLWHLLNSGFGFRRFTDNIIYPVGIIGQFLKMHFLSEADCFINDNKSALFQCSSIHVSLFYFFVLMCIWICTILYWSLKNDILIWRFIILMYIHILYVMQTMYTRTDHALGKMNWASRWYTPLHIFYCYSLLFLFEVQFEINTWPRDITV